MIDDLSAQFEEMRTQTVLKTDLVTFETKFSDSLRELSQQLNEEVRNLDERLNEKKRSETDLESRLWNAIEIIRGDLSKVEESEREIEKRLSVEITKMHHLIENHILKIEFTTFQTETHRLVNNLALTVSRKIKQIESDFRSMADGRVSTLESEFKECNRRMTEIDEMKQAETDLEYRLSIAIEANRVVLEHCLSEIRKIQEFHENHTVENEPSLDGLEFKVSEKIQKISSDLSRMETQRKLMIDWIAERFHSFWKSVIVIAIVIVIIICLFVSQISK
jgi:predicted  nucleic acid-binding Zn-ribbon protein